MRRLPVLLLAATGLLLAQPQPKTIVYARLGPTQTPLFISNADGTAERPLLTSDSLDYNPAWSPDGQWIVFTSERRRLGRPVSRQAGRNRTPAAHHQPCLRGPSGCLARWTEAGVCEHACRRHRGFVDSRSQHQSRDTAHVWAELATSGPPGRPTASGSRFPLTAARRSSGMAADSGGYICNLRISTSFVRTALR